MDGPHVCPAQPSDRTGTLTRSPCCARRDTTPCGSDSQGGSEVGRGSWRQWDRMGHRRDQEQKNQQPLTCTARTLQGASFPEPPAALGGPESWLTRGRRPGRAEPVNQHAGSTGQKRMEWSEGSWVRGSRGHRRHRLSSGPANLTPPADAAVTSCRIASVMRGWGRRVARGRSHGR